VSAAGQRSSMALSQAHATSSACARSPSRSSSRCGARSPHDTDHLVESTVSAMVRQGRMIGAGAREVPSVHGTANTASSSHSQPPSSLCDV
jgi:hypothetical protein